MANLTVTSQICIRIVLAFLHFLSTVQPGNNDEKEGLKRVAEILEDIFKIRPEMVVEDEQKMKRPGILETFFSTHEDEDTDEEKFEDADDEPSSSTASSSTRRTPSFRVGTARRASGRNMVNFQNEFKQLVLKNGSLWCLLGHSTPKSRMLNIIANLFNEAIAAAISQEEHFGFTMKEFAGTLKEMGNKAMESNAYDKAAGFYSCAIAISVDNAIYYCNRAKAVINLGMFHEAVADCYKAIRLNPYYVKAYYRIGVAYIEQHKYFDAISEGFLKALELDPNNKETLFQIELAEGKLSNQLSLLDDQLEELRRKGKIKRYRKIGIKEGSALIYKGKGQDGNSDDFVLVEEEKFNPEEIEETMSIQEFIELFSHGNIA